MWFSCMGTEGKHCSAVLPGCCRVLSCWFHFTFPLRFIVLQWKIADRATDCSGKASCQHPKRQLPVEHLLIQLLMNETLRLREPRGQQGMFWGREHDDILLIEPFDPT
jgi:hypothetical protein